jgi:hypothetical protein
VTKFGVFVDVGVHSELSAATSKIGQGSQAGRIEKVKVLSADV